MNTASILNIGSKVVEGLANAAATRNYLSSVAGAATALVVLGVLTPDQQQGALAAIQQMMDGVGQVIAGGQKLALIAGPIAVVAIAKVAGLRGTLKGRLRSITADDQVKIDGQIIVPKQVADAVPSKQVVSN